MQRWEYTILDFTKPRNDIDDLNRMGADGWEAVSMAATWGVSEKRLVHPIFCSSGRFQAALTRNPERYVRDELGARIRQSPCRHGS
jgi:hypothetical protein